MGLNRVNRYVNGISIKFVGKTSSCSSTCSIGGTRVSKHGHPVSTRYHRIMDQVGRNRSSASYKSWTRWCNKCRTESLKGFKIWPQLGEEFTEVCFIIKYPILIILYFSKLEAGENKILNFHVYYCFFVSCHNFELLQFCILLLAPLKCENYFKLVA